MSTFNHLTKKQPGYVIRADEVMDSTKSLNVVKVSAPTTSNYIVIASATFTNLFSD